MCTCNYEEPQPGFMELDNDEGLLLQFSANGRNVSDFKLERSDIEFVFEECAKWLREHPKEKTDDEISKEVTDALIRGKLYAGSSRAAALLRKIADNFDD
jgi:hypothetical protein